MDPEMHAARVLLAIVRERLDEARTLVRTNGLDDDRFVAVCRAADVHPWIHARLEAQDAAGIASPGVRAALRALRDRVRRDNLLLVARAEEALAVLARAGIRPVVLKGTDFLHRLYRAIDERTIDDVDLLVRPEDLESSLRALVAAGFALPDEARALHYVRTSHHVPLGAPGPIRVEFELHWNLAQTGRFRVDARELVERAEPITVGSHQALRLRDTDAVAHLVLHHFTHYFERRLKWIVDLGQLARAHAIDWGAVVVRLRSWGATQPAAAALVHMRRLAPAIVPQDVLRQLPLAPWRAALTRLLLSSHPLELWRGTRRRGVQLWLAAVLHERPAELPAWLLERRRREGRPSAHPLDAVVRALAAGGGR
jgi:putative nucleotidyltransferase-like protein